MARPPSRRLPARPQVTFLFDLAVVDGGGERLRLSAYLVGIPYLVARIHAERPELDLQPAVAAYEEQHGALPRVQL